MWEGDTGQGGLQSVAGASEQEITWYPCPTLTQKEVAGGVEKAHRGVPILAQG